MCQDKTWLDTCLQELPQLESPGIPSDKQSVDTACRAFKIGMLCVDQYVNTCVSVEGRFAINSNVAGARRAYASLCDDRNFQSEYLQHAPCYRNLSSDWEKCSKRFLDQDGSGQSDKLCCAQNAFLDCVYEAGSDHCRPDAARFLRQMANQLFKTSCHPSTYSAALCDSGHHIKPNFIHIVIITSMIAFTGFCVNV